MEELTNPRADRVREVAALSRRQSRERTGYFLVEGPQSVRELLDSDVPVRGLYATTAAAERYQQLMQVAARRGLVVRLGTREVLDRMSPDGQGLVAVADQISTPLTRLAEQDNPQLFVVLVQVQDPGNAGTVIRVADAAGAQGVVMTSSSVDLYNPKVVRSTAGSLFHLPITTGVDAAAAIRTLQDRGIQVLAATGDGQWDLDDLAYGEGLPDLRQPTAWLLGNEASGLPESLLSLADHTVRIALHGRAESLNLGTAAAVCLYSSARVQRRGAAAV